jgi:hypothetical protein
MFLLFGLCRSGLYFADLKWLHPFVTWEASIQSGLLCAKKELVGSLVIWGKPFRGWELCIRPIAESEEAQKGNSFAIKVPKRSLGGM